VCKTLATTLWINERSVEAMIQEKQALRLEFRQAPVYAIGKIQTSTAGKIQPPLGGNQISNQPEAWIPMEAMDVLACRTDGSWKALPS